MFWFLATMVHSLHFKVVIHCRHEPLPHQSFQSLQHRGNTPLHFCYSYGYGETLGKYLITKGADTSIRNREGLTCFEGLSK